MLSEPSYESRSSHAVRALAEALLRMRSGSHIERVGDLARTAGVSAGTMHKALQVLVSEGTVRAVRTQRYGTTIEELDYARLWKYAGNGAVLGILPMPLSASAEGLAAAASEAVAALGLEVTIAYREGALKRVAALEAGHADFTVLSNRALDTIGRVTPIHEFGPGSYYGDTGIFRLRRPGDVAVERVAADADSPDHSALVQAEFPGVRVFPVPMRRIPGIVAAGRLDATVWFGGTAIPVRYVGQLAIEPAVSDEATALNQASAVIAVCRDGRPYELLRALDKDVLRRAYEAIVAADATHYPLVQE